MEFDELSSLLGNKQLCKSPFTSRVRILYNK
jgi:hypothetical protein